MSYLTASDYDIPQEVDNDNDDDASFVTAASSDYKSDGSIIFELPDEDTQPTAKHACSSFITPVSDKNASIQFYFEDQGTQPTEKHIYLSFITTDTVENDASIRLCFDTKDDDTENYQPKPTDPVLPKTTMFYNPSAVQDTYDKDKFSSHSIDEVLNLYSYEDITGQNTKRTYAETLSAEAQEYYDFIEAFSDNPILFPRKPDSLTS